MKYIKLKKTDSICNICKQNKPLTWDHIPPKGGIDLSDMWVQSLTKSIIKDDNPRMIISQNGLKYRTLCRECNSLLGKYDIAFKNLFLDVKMLAETSLHLPPSIKLKTYPVRIVKSLLGHILASKTYPCDSIDDNAIRKYLLDDNEKLPDNIRVFYWYYPYNCTIIKTDVHELDINTNTISNYSVLKSFPLAFAMSFDNSFLEHTNELIINSSDKDSTEKNLIFNKSIAHRWDFPEKLGDGKVHLVPQDHTNILAIPKK